MATALLSSVEEDGAVRALAHVGIMQQWPVPLKRHGAVAFFPSAITDMALLSPEDADRWLDWAEEPLRDRGKPRSTRETAPPDKRPKCGAQARPQWIADHIG